MQAMGQLTGGLAHDFNNLLTAVLGSLDLIRRYSTDAQIQRLADSGLSATRRETYGPVACVFPRAAAHNLSNQCEWAHRWHA
jgi:hypothetical protein